MRRAIVGTAGHIDHGKTSLVLALTGIDCDRWAEEKARGITIDLGFAHLTEGDLQLGFVDVPGHERFLHNALAGLGGIRIMMLVVAADEGVKPQTREHLAVCSLLGIPAGLVVLTKVDLVSPDLLELAQLEVEELLATTPFAGAAVLPVSSTTGQGIPELKATLLDLAARHVMPEDRERPARLPIDRAFHLKGLGVVVTGTLASGAVRPGDTLEILPRSERVRVRSVQVHGQSREEAEAGERTSLQLSGVSLEELNRGMQLGLPEAFEATTSLLARFTLLPDAPAPVRGFVPVRLHLYASEVLGRMRPLNEGGLAPGETGPAEIRLEAPVSAARGDRYILRRPSPPATLGGGEILDPRWRRHRGSILRQALGALDKDLHAALAFWVQEAGERGIEATELSRRLGLPPVRVAARL
ncbi:MAG TPA: selenocysteine-specific translation elongation factor, partial [Thermoanaerobaculia bacterium]